MVGQEPVLFNRNIKDNIAYGINTTDENNIIDDTLVMHAAEQANAHGFVTDLVSGYNTMCGQRGGHLSG
jgi:ATP-binding cassette subfamily B (MDR/TAP) protein 1